MASMPAIFLERAVAFANFLLIEGWTSVASETIEFSCARSGEADATTILCDRVVRLSRPDVDEIARASNRNSQYSGFIARAPLRAVAGVSPFDRSIVWQARSGGRVAQVAGAARTVGRLGGALDAGACETLSRALACDLIGRPFAILFESLTRDPTGPRALAMHVDGNGRAGDVVGFDLWIENAQENGIVALSDDGVYGVDHADLTYYARADVSAHLAAQRLAVRTNFHGVFFLLQEGSVPIQRLWIGAALNGRIEALGSIAVENATPGDGLVARAAALLGGGGLPDPDTAERWLRPMIARTKPQVGCRTNIFRRPNARPEISIVVPMYGEHYFIRSLMAMQLLFGERAEWIIVCDDRRIESTLAAYLKRRTSSFCGDTIFVRNDDNYGYSIANTIGVNAATCDHILFMNSDIWLDSIEAIEIGREALRGGRYGLVGFRLTYEDGTIQHDGMSFERRSVLHGLFAVNHPGKGLPPRPASRQIEPALAVTGALMLASREALDEVGGFSSDYILGDFEDADLCLKVAASGKGVGLARASGCYHLERQSIRKMGDAGYREAVTYVNCIHFNRRWKRELEALEASETRFASGAIH